MRPQYADVVQALAPVLHDLPPKLIALDGWPKVGKTTLGRFLAWRFNVALLETDLFLVPPKHGHDRLVYLTDQITRIIDKRLQRSERPIVVEGVAVLQLLQHIQRSPDFVVYVANQLVSDAGVPRRGADGLRCGIRPASALTSPSPSTDRHARCSRADRIRARNSA